jgi:hypothetical protein
MYYLKKEGYEIFKTEFWAMADRKIAQGWKLCAAPEAKEVPKEEKPKKAKKD